MTQTSIANEMPLRERFLQGMSHAACTVNIVATDGPAGRYGLTVSAMASVTADTPHPTLLVCVNESSQAARAIVTNERFAVNILRDDQFLVSDRFAGRSKSPNGDKFSNVDITPDALGCPRIIGSLVSFSCRLASWQTIGTHLVLMGSVEDVVMAGSGSPLIYANRSYGRPMPLWRDSRETAAQQA
ncbi:flavin reductase family protein [Bradyrhizobium prioriisuperbiae]|uniref:flavin reductase family protein n=1 Tax=Bradyrhizobium prioriisuperbiae TaxID=2854389 RepID=UPI0028E86EA9|nr:flavin reductase family protein [Bradyrhizobium prioritasuperba]